MNKQTILAVILVTLSGCGTTAHDRAISGTGLGAGTGAIVGAVTGLSVLEGAALGAAAGGLTGVLTDERDVNLGDPLWKRGASRSSGTPVNQTVISIQSHLNELGYDAGPVDGRMGPRTRDAVRAYQRDHGLLVDGRVTPELAAHIRRSAS